MNTALRGLVKSELSPTNRDRSFVSTVYEAVANAIGRNNCLQIGSFARFTAVVPLHDLDVLYMAGAYPNETPNPADVLNDLEDTLENSFTNPTRYECRISRQTHSATIKFFENQTEVFSVDVVPGYTNGTNEFGSDVYVVPEILSMSHGQRTSVRNAISAGEREMQWIPSDPRGYNEVARRLNEANPDFRRAAKLVKGWRNACKKERDDFPFKSFHLEQAIASQFMNDPNTDIFTSVFNIMKNVEDLLLFPSFSDRADPTVFIDAYVEQLQHSQRRLAAKARDHFMITLENASSAEGLAALFSGECYERASQVESFLFEQNIPVLTEGGFAIIATVRQGNGFRREILDRIGWIARSREIDFTVGPDVPDCDLFKWKVKNDDSSRQPRGEITDHHTQRQPETARYFGHHFVECYAIRDGVCIALARQDVRLSPNQA